MNEILIIHNICGERNEDVILTTLNFEKAVNSISEAVQEDHFFIFRTREGVDIAIKPSNIIAVSTLPEVAERS